VPHAVSFLLGCLPELSNDNIQPNTTSYALLQRHDCFNPAQVTSAQFGQMVVLLKLKIS